MLEVVELRVPRDSVTLLDDGVTLRGCVAASDQTFGPLPVSYRLNF